MVLLTVVTLCDIVTDLFTLSQSCANGCHLSFYPVFQSIYVENGCSGTVFHVYSYCFVKLYHTCLYQWVPAFMFFCFF